MSQTTQPYYLEAGNITCTPHLTGENLIRIDIPTACPVCGFVITVRHSLREDGKPYRRSLFTTYCSHFNWGYGSRHSKFWELSEHLNPDLICLQCGGIHQ
jgi:hypothetical protein